MKKYFVKILIFTALPFFTIFVGCNKNDSVEGNKITFELDNYSLSQGFISNRGVSGHNPTTYAYDLVLSSKGLTYDNVAEEFTGEGDYLYLTLYSNDAEFLADGSYTFDPYASKDSLTIDDGAIGIDTLFLFSTNNNVVKITNGEIKVKRVGINYKLDFNFYTQDDEQISGIYNGLLGDFALNYVDGAGSLRVADTDYNLDAGSFHYIKYTDEAIPYKLKVNLTGEFGRIYFYVPSNSYKDRLKDGIYSIHESQDLFYFYSSTCVIKDIANPLIETDYDISNGYIIIAQDRKVYTITLNLYSDNTHITGSYKGLFEYSVVNSSATK